MNKKLFLPLGIVGLLLIAAVASEGQPLVPLLALQPARVEATNAETGRQQALLALAVVGLPALVSFAFNGPLITWTLPDFPSYFLGFLAVIQALFITVFGILFSGVAALVSRAPRPATRTS